MELRNKNTSKLVNNIDKARAQAISIDHIITHLTTKDFYEVRGEYRDTGEEIFNDALSIVFKRGDQELNKEILNNINYIKSTSSSYGARQTV